MTHNSMRWLADATPHLKDGLVVGASGLPDLVRGHMPTLARTLLAGVRTCPSQWDSMQSASTFAP